MQPGGVGSKKKYDVGGNVVKGESFLDIPEKLGFDSALFPEQEIVAGEPATGQFSSDDFKKNNPGNVESNQDWAGAIGTYANERLQEKGKSPFAVFSSPVLGIRALAMDFRTKIGNTKGNLREIITQYAPENENKTQNYINFIQKELALKKDDKGNFRRINEKDLPVLVEAVIKFENTKADKDYYMKHPEWIKEGIELSKKSIPGTLKTLEEVREYIYPTLEEGGFVSA
jgi:hypothetical protein